MHFYTNVFTRFDKIYCVGFANGKRFYDEVDYEPYLFIPDSSGTYKTLEGRPAKKQKFRSIKDARDFCQRYSDVENFEYYGLTQWPYVFINDEFPGKVEYDSSLIAVNVIDIEVESKNGMPRVDLADQPVTAIALCRDEKVICFGTKYYKPKNPNHQYVLCDDEADLLTKFLDVWNSEEWKCDIVTGWYIEGFDIPYIVNRILNVLGEKAMYSLSPWRIVKTREIVRGKSNANSSSEASERTDTIYEIAGITQLDYLQLYKKFTFTNHESYRLDNIAFVELGQRKVSYEGTLDELYENDPETFYDYNIHDTVLPQRLENKLGFIKQVMALAYTAKTNFLDAFTTTRPWDVIIHYKLLDKGIVLPQQKHSHFRSFEGAFVEDPKIGLHKSVVSFDFTSLYPSLISQHNISNETFVRAGFETPKLEDLIEFKNTFENVTETLQADNVTLTANKCLFRKDIRGFIPAIVDEFIMMRKLVKNEMLDLQKKNDPKDKIKIIQLDNYQQALKILTNGLYGALGNRYFRWFDLNLAEAVTATGQLYIKWCMRRVNEYLNKILKTEHDYIVAGDTDSLYINLEPLIEKMGLKDRQEIIEFLDNACKTKIEPLIKAACDELAGILNSYNTIISMKREIIADKAIWRGKKMYILNVYDKEGIRYEKPKMTFKGIEAVRSSTPMLCRTKLKESFRIMLQENEVTLHKYINEFYKEFMDSDFIAIAFPRTVDGIDMYYDPVLICKPRTPIHVAGSIRYNAKLKELGLTKQYSLIKNKDKIRYAYLKQPNPFKSHVIAIPDEGTVPKAIEKDIIKYVDKQMQWEKSFKLPVESITSIIGWSVEKRATVMSFFS